MPSDKELLKKKLMRLETIPEDFINTVGPAERKIYNDLVDALKKLKLDENGNIILNSENFSMIEVLGIEFENAVSSSGYYDNVKDFIKEFNTQKQLNRVFYEETVSGFENKDVFDLTYDQSKKTAVDLLANTAVNENVSLLKDTLNNAISNNTNVLDLQKLLEQQVIGGDGKLGALSKYAKQEAGDLFSIAERNYTTAISKEFGIEFFYYAGGEIETTRCFCVQRHGNTYHKKEIEEWGNKKGLGACNTGGGWQGMAAGTDASTIFSLLGGYNCRHSLVPRGINETPIDDIERAISKGYINLEDLPERIQDKLK